MRMPFFHEEYALLYVQMNICLEKLYWFLFPRKSRFLWFMSKKSGPKTKKWKNFFPYYNSCNFSDTLEVLLLTKNDIFISQKRFSNHFPSFEKMGVIAYLVPTYGNLSDKVKRTHRTIIRLIELVFCAKCRTRKSNFFHLSEVVCWKCTHFAIICV